MLKYFFNIIGTVYVLFHVIGLNLNLQPLKLDNSSLLLNLVTYHLVHTSSIHLLVNLFTLHTACKILNNTASVWYYLKFYVIAIIITGVSHLVFSDIALAGASGGILSMIVFAVVLYPKYDLDGTPAYQAFLTVLTGMLIYTITTPHNNTAWIPHLVAIIYGAVMGLIIKYKS